MADLIQNEKENNAPKLYCKNRLGLEACLEKHFTEQQHLSNFIIRMHQHVWLVGGSNTKEGRVEVYYGGKRGKSCDDGFDNNDAKVIYRMFGYSGGTPLRRDAGHKFGQGTGEIL